MDALELDCLIASEMGAAVGMSEPEDTVKPELSCPLCQHEPGWLEVIRNENYIVCFGCGNIYGIVITPQARLESELATAALAAERDQWLQDERDTLADTQR